jgi:hypothetical protein
MAEDFLAVLGLGQLIWTVSMEGRGLRQGSLLGSVVLRGTVCPHPDYCSGCGDSWPANRSGGVGASSSFSSSPNSVPVGTFGGWL